MRASATPRASSSCWRLIHVSSNSPPYLSSYSRTASCWNNFIRRKHFSDIGRQKAGIGTRTTAAHQPLHSLLRGGSKATYTKDSITKHTHHGPDRDLINLGSLRGLPRYPLLHLRHLRLHLPKAVGTNGQRDDSMLPDSLRAPGDSPTHAR